MTTRYQSNQRHRKHLRTAAGIRHKSFEWGVFLRSCVLPFVARAAAQPNPAEPSTATPRPKIIHSFRVPPHDANLH